MKGGIFFGRVATFAKSVGRCQGVAGEDLVEPSHVSVEGIAFWTEAK